MQLIVMENNHQLVQRPAVQTDHQTGKNQGYRRQPFSPRDAENQRPDKTGPRQRGELRSQNAGNRPQCRHRHPQLSAGRDPEGGRFRQRVAQHLLEQHAHQSEPRANQQRHRQSRQQAVVEQHLSDIVDIRLPQRLAPLVLRQRRLEIQEAERKCGHRQHRQQQCRQRRQSRSHASPPWTSASTRAKCIADSVAP